MKKEQALIFTDGSALGNPGPGGWGAVVAFDGVVQEVGGRATHTTNNRMEISAIIGALSSIPAGTSALVHTDSAYAINGITKWVRGWKQREWVTAGKQPVANRDLWEALSELTETHDLSWRHVPGHSGVLGNERADEIATAYAKGEHPKLFRANKEDYLFDVSDISYDVKKKKARSASRAKRGIPAYSYVSVVGGVMKKHATWAECERAVKGKAGTRYKKTVSKEDERATLRAWGF